jgi:hypothetical protein
LGATWEAPFITTWNKQGFNCSVAQDYGYNASTTAPHVLYTICADSPALRSAIANGKALPSSGTVLAAYYEGMCNRCLPEAAPGYIYVFFSAAENEPFCPSGCQIVGPPPSI